MYKNNNLIQKETIHYTRLSKYLNSINVINLIQILQNRLKSTFFVTIRLLRKDYCIDILTFHNYLMSSLVLHVAVSETEGKLTIKILAS